MTTQLLNVERAAELMAVAGVDALVATTPENVTYLTGYDNWPMYVHRHHGVFAVLRADGVRGLVVPMDACEYLVERSLDGLAIHTHGSFFIAVEQGRTLSTLEAELVARRDDGRHAAEPLAALKALLADLGVADVRIGLDAGGLAAATEERCRGLLTHPWQGDGAELFRAIRQVKTEPEIDRLRRAATTVEQGMLTAFAEARPGSTEADLERAFRAATLRLGATPGHCETNFGVRAAGCFPPSDLVSLELGQVVRSDCGGRYRCYWADTGRSAACGDIAPELEKAHAALVAGMAALSAAVRPGVAAAELLPIGVETVRESGLPGFDRRHVGHGIGLDMYEYPMLARAGSAGPDEPRATLVEGMVINLELPYYELGVGGLQLEDTVVVRADGPEFLTTASHGFAQTQRQRQEQP